jgi:hypothetical protein
MKDTKDASPAFVVGLLMLWVLWTLMFNSAYFDLMDISRLGYNIALTVVGCLGFVVNLLFSSIWRCVFSRQHVRVDDGESTAISTPLIEENNSDTRETTLDVESSAIKTPSPPSKKEQVHYINNIKIFLTVVVIVFHCASGCTWWPGLISFTSNPMNWGVISLNLFMGTCSSYFMNAFFFYSGLFVPKSMDKKGLYNFCLDKMKRLGIPFVAYEFLIGPYVEYGFVSIFFGISYPGPPGPQVTWFINQLMLLSLLYGIACGVGWSPKISCPSLLSFLVIGACIGLLTGILLLFFPQYDMFFSVAMFWGDYPSYPLYFFGGALAQRNGWMDEIKEKSRAAIYGLMILFWLIFAVVYTLFFKRMPVVASALFTGIVWKGLLSMTICLAMTVFFMDYVNKSYFCTRVFSKAMYTSCKYIYMNDASTLFVSMHTY